MGKDSQTHTGESLHALCRELEASSVKTVAFLDAYQKMRIRPLHSGAVVAVIEKGTPPPEDRLSEEMFPARHTPGVHEKG